MSIFSKPYCLIMCCLLLQLTGITQPANASTNNLQHGLFDSDEILNIKIAGNLRAVMNDRGDNPVYHPLTFSYFNKDSTEIAMPVNIKTRGHFRKDKSICIYPPLLIHFAGKDSIKGTLFAQQNKLKLVMPCRGGDEYVTREYLVYKLYNLITPKSFKARLVRVTMEDTKRKQTNFYGILLEEEDQMAARNGLVPVKRKLMKPALTDNDTYLTMSVFEYMIGNTDWSVEFQQNVKLIATDSLAMPATVAYDFDHSGLVNAPYAEPADALGMTSVQERRYRGYCITNMERYDSILALFNRLKPDFYKVYTSCPLLDEKYVRTVTRYFDKFYDCINNPSAVKKEFCYPCDPNGTGNVIIKGLAKE